MRWLLSCFKLSLEGSVKLARSGPERAGRCVPFSHSVRYESVPPISQEFAGALQGRSDEVCDSERGVGRKDRPAEPASVIPISLNTPGTNVSKGNVCDVCGKGFTSKSSLTVHYRVHTGEKPYECDLCHAAFATARQVTLHRRIHTGEKPYKCDVCDAAFALSNHLTQHRRVHTGEKPYKCDLCDKGFSQSGNLKTHMIRVHSR